MKIIDGMFFVIVIKSFVTEYFMLYLLSFEYFLSTLDTEAF